MIILFRQSKHISDTSNRYQLVVNIQRNKNVDINGLRGRPE